MNENVFNPKLLFVVLGMLAHCACCSQSFNKNAISRLDSSLRRFSKQITNRAIVCALYQEGQDTTLHYGKVNFLGRKVTDTDLFQIGSVTKTWTGYMLAQRLKNNQLNMNTSLSLFLRNRNKEKYATLTIEQLVTHTSGLPNYSFAMLAPPILSYWGISILSTQLILIPLQVPSWVISVPWRLAVIPPPIPFFSSYGDKILRFDLRHLSAKRLRKRNGEFHYSNIGMGLLGKIMADKDSISYGEMLQKQVCTPLGLQNTVTRVNKEQRKNYSTPHNILGLKVFRTKFGKGGIEGAGDIKSNLKDMLKYLKIQMDSTTHPEAYQITQLQHKTYFVSEDKIGLEMGLGWIKYNPDGQNPIIWHNGQVSGSSAFIGFIPDKKIGIVILANTAKAKKITRIGFTFLNAYKQ